jgi:hypothetical protein
VSVLRYAREHECPWDWHTSDGQLATLQWAHEHGCPWNEVVCTLGAAAKFGSMEVLQWARAHDCPWDEDVCAFRRLGWAPRGWRVAGSGVWSVESERAADRGVTRGGAPNHRQGLALLHSSGQAEPFLS